MMRPAILAAALALTACVSTPGQPPHVRITNDPGGGFLAHHERWLNHWAALGTAEVDGFCGSACTMVLMLGPDVCTTPGSVWAFHASSDGRGTIGLEATALMRVYYPPGLQVWFDQNAAHLHGADYAQLSGAEMIDAGYVKECL